MASPILILLILFGSLVALGLAVVLVIYVVVPLFRVIGFLIAHMFRLVGGEIGDLFRLVGSLITALIFVPMVILSIVIGRWSATSHYGRAVQNEILTAGACLYRMGIGHPARFLGLRNVTEGIEQRLPEVVAAAPGRDRPTRQTGRFDGYRIVGSLRGGGSGGKLYIAEPDAMRLAAFERAGQKGVDRVVIKSFSLRDGSSLPQIIRESRALDSAKNLGLILDHELSDERFFYVMRYVPGDALGLVTANLHGRCGENGLDDAALGQAMAYAADLLRTLDTYHRGGLWHKDVKPDNIIVHDERAHLVDLGLVTPMRSAMTLTTHGTEYFRDPELVRMALKGVKVHQVDGAKFDLYAAGAVLYSVVENSFPAHGGLSQVTKRCPESLRWVIRRAMTDYDKRYASAQEMLDDLEVIRRASDPFAVRPAALPSMHGGLDAPEVESVDRAATPVPPRAEPVAARAARPVPPPPPPPVGPTGRPRLRVTNWWTGGYVREGDRAAPPWAGAVARAEAGRGARAARVPAGVRMPAAEQLRSARSRAQAARQRAVARANTHRRRLHERAGDPAGMNMGVAVAVFLFLSACAALAGALIWGYSARRGQVTTTIISAGPNASVQQGAGTDGAVEKVELGEFAKGLGMSFDDVLKALNVARVESRQRMAAISAAAPIVNVNDAGQIEFEPTEGSGLVNTRMVFLSDFRPPLPDGVRTGIETGVADLLGAGVRLVGDMPDADDEAIEIMAQLERARGQNPLDSGAAAGGVIDWIKQRDDVDIVLWVEPTAADDSCSQYIIVGRGGMEGGVVSECENISQVFQRALRAAIDWN